MTTWSIRTIVLSMLLAPGALVVAQLEPTAPRLRAGASVPLAPSLVIGGGEVVLDVTVGRSGAVAAIQPVRATSPYTDLMTGAVQGWAFDAATTPVEGLADRREGHVLVMAVFRPPQVYASPARGEPTTVVGELSAELPQPGALGMPVAYPPRATHDGTVLIEIELTAAAVVRGVRVMSRASPFDSAALETVKGWRFDFPRKPTGASQLFAYAVVGFREPITP